MDDRIKAGLWVRFTDDGIPAWFGPAWVDGAEFVEGVTGETLITHRRVDGEWVLRDPQPQPTPEEIEALAKAQAADAAAFAEEQRDAALREALADEADPVFFKWQRDEATRADWLAKVAEVKSRFPKPGA
jgi:hypothetical protein